VTMDVGRIVSLGSMIGRDSTLAELHDLEFGWRATRVSVDAPWVREKNHPFPTHAENGYYLGDAVWMSEYRDDVNPPAPEIREDLKAGAYVKLLFRFAAEDAVRCDGEVERMWVRITGLDEDDYYIGVLDNDPRHADVLSCGDTIRFHPVHVMEVLRENGE